MAERLEALATLEQALAVAPGAASPLTPEQVDTRADRIIAQMSRGAYDEAARASEALLREGVRDVRLVCPSLFGAVLAKGPRALPTILSALHQVFTRAWEQLGPHDEQKPTLADSGLLWLFKSIHKHLEFLGRAQDEAWTRWVEGCSQAHVQEALQLAQELHPLLEHRLPGGNAATRLVQLTGWLTEHRDLFPEAMERVEHAPPPVEEKAPPRETPAPIVETRREQAPIAREEVPARKAEETAPEAPELFLEDEDEDEDEDDDEEDDDEEDDDEAPPREVPARLPARREPSPRLEPSPALAQLLLKLAAFDGLVERQDFSRASMVAADLLHVIDHFDPLVYMPSLFSRFLSSLSTHGERIEPRMTGARTLSERALERLYRTDLEAFLDPAARVEDGR